MKNLMDVAGLTSQLQLRGGAAASEEDLRRIHPAHYLERFKAISDSAAVCWAKRRRWDRAAMKSPAFLPDWPVPR
ncbi:hypothetical protein DMH27_21690 [Raoultella planticola]|nr:hypothetical protein [Raoultella planticola]